MSIFELVSILLSFAAVFAYVNLRFIKLPTTIGIMFISLVFSLALLAIHQLGYPIDEYARSILSKIDFHETLMNGMLSFLLFAGALHINLDDLKKQKLPIFLLSTFGLCFSAFLIGVLSFYILGYLGFNIQFIYCLLFGALISPTDPIAVLALLKSANAPKSLETKIAGESLFNDGVGVVLFIIIFELATGHAELTLSSVVILTLKETIGGVILGGVIGGGTYYMLKSIDNYKVEVLLTLALVCGGYCLAHALGTSGPIAMVVSGLLIGNQGRSFAMSDKTVAHIDPFWELIDEILNSVLFTLIGLELLIITFKAQAIIAGLVLIPVVLLVRYISVAPFIWAISFKRKLTPNVSKIMTWGGLRGGISVALALSIPVGPERETIIVITYIIVVFSILVQGTTFKRVLAKLIRS